MAVPTRGFPQECHIKGNDFTSAREHGISPITTTERSELSRCLWRGIIPVAGGKPLNKGDSVLVKGGRFEGKNGTIFMITGRKPEETMHIKFGDGTTGYAIEGMLEVIEPE